MGSLLEGPGGVAPLPGALKVMKKRLWGWETPFMCAQATWSGLLYRGLRVMVERGSGCRASFSLCEENLEEGLPCWGPWWISR
jgi:hypothetical protein